MADKEQLARLKRSVKVWNNWREKNPGVEINLGSANLRRANLRRANLRFADLSKADLGGADLCWADLLVADLSKADLRGADLREINLRGASLDRADLRGARLSYADLSESDLSKADFRGCRFGSTSLGDVDLSTVKGLEKVKHEYPSEIGIRTIYLSNGNIPEVFLRGCGVPENFITFMHSLTGKAFDFYTCFISHSGKDKLFCERLYADLQAKGVRTWYFPKDAKWGETVWGEIDRGIKIYDKLVVVCSKKSLQSVPVQREIERALKREDREHTNILFPISLDRYLFDEWEHERKEDVVAKVVGDFRGWDKDAAKYQEAFEKLLRGLQAEDRKG